VKWFGIVLSLFGWLIMEQHLPATVKTGNLDFVVMSVNGKVRQLAAGETVKVVWGDRLKVMFAQLENGQRDVELINVVGFRARADSIDDRDAEFRSDKDLSANWAQGPRRNIFRVNIKSKRLLHGRVFIEVEEPYLDYVVAQINGIKHQLRADQKVLLRSIDQIKLEQVVANLDPEDPSFRFRIIHHPQHSDQESTHEIRFFRYERLFAKIPLVVAD